MRSGVVTGVGPEMGSCAEIEVICHTGTCRVAMWDRMWGLSEEVKRSYSKWIGEVVCGAGGLVSSSDAA